MTNINDPSMILLYMDHVMYLLSLKWDGAFLTTKHTYAPHIRNNPSPEDRHTLNFIILGNS